MIRGGFSKSNLLLYTHFSSSTALKTLPYLSSPPYLCVPLLNLLQTTARYNLLQRLQRGAAANGRSAACAAAQQHDRPHHERSVHVASSPGRLGNGVPSRESATTASVREVASGQCRPADLPWIRAIVPFAFALPNARHSLLSVRAALRWTAEGRPLPGQGSVNQGGPRASPVGASRIGCHWARAPSQARGSFELARGPPGARAARSSGIERCHQGELGDGRPVS